MVKFISRLFLPPGFILFTAVIYMIKLFDYRVTPYSPIAVYISFLVGAILWAGALLLNFYSGFASAVVICFLVLISLAFPLDL